MRQIRRQSAEKDNAEESPSSIDLLGDEVGCLAIAILFGSAAICAPLGTSASAVSIIARNWISRKAIPLVLPQATNSSTIRVSFGGEEAATCVREGCRTRL